MLHFYTCHFSIPLGSVSAAAPPSRLLSSLAFSLLYCPQDGGSLDQVLKEAKRIPEEILGKVSIAVSVQVPGPPPLQHWVRAPTHSPMVCHLILTPALSTWPGVYVATAPA